MIFESHDGRHQRTEQRALGEMFMGYGRQSEGEAIRNTSLPNPHKYCGPRVRCGESNR